jgi:hypothetical protein
MVDRRSHRCHKIKVVIFSHLRHNAHLNNQYKIRFLVRRSRLHPKIKEMICSALDNVQANKRAISLVGLSRHLPHKIRAEFNMVSIHQLSNLLRISLGVLFSPLFPKIKVHHNRPAICLAIPRSNLRLRTRALIYFLPGFSGRHNSRFKIRSAVHRNVLPHQTRPVICSLPFNVQPSSHAICLQVHHNSRRHRIKGRIYFRPRPQGHLSNRFRICLAAHHSNPRPKIKARTSPVPGSASPSPSPWPTIHLAAPFRNPVPRIRAPNIFASTSGPPRPRFKIHLECPAKRVLHRANPIRSPVHHLGLHRNPIHLLLGLHPRRTRLRMGVVPRPGNSLIFLRVRHLHHPGKSLI